MMTLLCGDVGGARECGGAAGHPGYSAAAGRDSQVAYEKRNVFKNVGAKLSHLTK